MPDDIPLTQAAFGYLLDDQQRLLLVANDYGARGIMWGVPGGAQEPGESAAACVVREFAEEVGLAVAVVADCGTIRRRKPAWNLNLHARFFDVRCADPRPCIDPDEEHVVDCRWLARDEIAALPGVVLGRAYLLDRLDDREGYPKHFVMAPDEE